MIDAFWDEYDFLSNFYYSPVMMDGVSYGTVEHAFQASKTLDPKQRDEIRRARKPGLAKWLGRQSTLRSDWEEIKLQVMEDLVRQKFTRHKDLARNLLATGQHKLVEGNWWGDDFWGVYRGKGQNHLGKILMKIREELLQIELARAKAG